jgi:hypothetical protein
MHAKFDFAFFDASDGVAVIGDLGKQGGFGGSKFHVHGESIAEGLDGAKGFLRLGDDFRDHLNLALHGENFHALELELGDLCLKEGGIAIERAFGNALVRLELPHHPRILPNEVHVEEGAVGKLGDVEGFGGGGGGGGHGVVSLSAFILAHPITHATSIASFFSLFSVVEIGRNKLPPPFSGNSGAQGFRKPPGVVFFNLSPNFQHSFSSPIYHSILPYCFSHT